MPANIRIKPSRSFALLLALACLLTICSLWLTSMPAEVQAMLILIVLVSFFYHLFYRLMLRDKHAWRSFSLERNSLMLKTHAGEEWLAEVLPDSIVTSHFVLLRAKLVQGGVISQVIFRDALGDNAFRELRVNLRYS